MYKVKGIVVASILLYSSSILAQTDSTKQKRNILDSVRKLQDVVVLAQKGLNDKTPTIGKGNIVARDLPQLTQTIDKAILDRQQVLKMSDLLQNTTGVYISGNTGGYQEEIASRGYAFSSNNTFKNGARFNNGVMPELSNVEKVEFLKGGAAILYGNVSPGGLMNIVTKKPKFEKGGEISIRVGSFDFIKPTIDLYGALGNSKKMAYRVNSTFEKANSFRDKVKHERIYYNPSFVYEVSKKTNILIEGDYLKEQRTADFGIGAINYTLPNVPRSNFIGVNWGYNNVEQATVTSTLTHTIDSNWQIKAVYAVQSFEQDLFSAARPNANSQAVKADGTWIRGLQKSATKEAYQIGQIDLTGNFKTGLLKHQILLGADMDQYQTKSTAFNSTLFNNQSSNTAIRNKNIYDTISIINPTQKRNDIPDLTAARITNTPIYRYGIYVQDLIHLTQNFKALVGLRYSQQENKVALVDTIGKGKGTIAGYTTNAWSPKLGLVYQPIKTMSIFTSYTNNFSPNTGTDINNTALMPSIIHQYELGVKNDLFKGLLSLNFTAYRIINSNFAQTVIPAPSNNPMARELAGEVTSDGFEMDIMSKSIHGFSIIAGYSYNDARYTKSNIYSVGDRLRYNPMHTANGSLYYHFNDQSTFKGLNAGIGFYYVGERVAGRNTSLLNPNYLLMKVPNYTLFDCSIGYQQPQYSIRCKFSNLSNVLSYNVHDDNSVNPIAPRQLSISFTQFF